MSTSPGPGCGTATASTRNTSGPPTARITTACIVLWSRVDKVGDQYGPRGGVAMFRLASVAALLVGSAVMACAQDYPSRPITIVVPFPAGGTADLLPRLIGEPLRAGIGQAIVVENKSGAGGNIGLEFVARAAPDGYTLLNAPQLSFSVNHLLNPNLRVDPRAMEPVSVLATYPAVIFAKASLPVENLADL